jgi:quercetin dioxygenase-like cupin family protein
VTIVIKAAEVPLLDRGGGVTTIPLVTHRTDDSAAITTGISIYPEGAGAPLHVHNCDEQATLLEGQAEVEIEGEVTPLVPYDSIAAGLKHAFRNTGQDPMRILWIYPTQDVTRTLISTGETVAHLSDDDLIARTPSSS